MNLKRSRPRFVAVDFFCGAGGATRGMLDAGGYVAAGVDIDGSCSLTYRRNNRNHALDRRYPAFMRERIDDYAILERRITGEIGWTRAQLPLLFAVCAPCQPFRKTNSRGLSSSRRAKWSADANLLFHMLPYISRFKPDAVISENVPGAAKANPGGKIWQRFIARLRSLGYRVGSKRVCASDFGIPQRRKRLIMVAIRSPHAFYELDVPSGDPAAPRMGARDAIGHLPPLAAGETHPRIPNHQCSSLAPNRLSMLQALKPGENNDALFDMPDLTPIHMRRRLEITGQKRDFKNSYTRLHPNLPSVCITTRFNETACGRFGHYEQHRALSLREGAALQSFPDQYKFYGQGIVANARMIGNALPPRLMRFMAGFAMDCYEGAK